LNALLLEQQQRKDAPAEQGCAGDDEGDGEALGVDGMLRDSEESDCGC
jgi:hypothetical protein